MKKSCVFFPGRWRRITELEELHHVRSQLLRWELCGCYNPHLPAHMLGYRSAWGKKKKKKRFIPEGIFPTAGDEQRYDLPVISATLLSLAGTSSG